LRTSGRRSPPRRREGIRAPHPSMRDHLGKRKAGDLPEIIDLHRRERLYVQGGEPLPQGAQHRQVEVEGEVGVQPPDDVKFRRPLLPRLFRPEEDSSIVIVYARDRPSPC